MSLLSLIADLGVNINPFRRGLNDARSFAEKWGTDLGNDLKGRLAGFFSGAALIEGVRRILDYAGEIKDLSTRLEIGTDDLQAFKFAAEQTGGSVEAIANALKKIKVAQGTKEMADEWRALGFSFNDIQSKRPAELFEEIAAKVQKSALSAREFKAALAIMGKTADELFPAMKEGLADTASTFKQFKLGIDKDTVENLDAVGDALGFVWAAAKNFGASNLNKPLQGLGALTDLAAAQVNGFKSLLGNEEAGAKGMDRLKSAFRRFLPESIGKKFLPTTADDEKVAAELRKKHSEEQAVQRDKAAIAEEQEKKNKKELLDLEQKLKGVKFQMLDDDQKRVELQKRLVEAQQEYYDSVKGSVAEKKAEYDIAQARKDLKDLDAKGDKVGKIHADSLAEVGGYVGRASTAQNSMQDIARAQLAVQRQIAVHTDPNKQVRTTYF